MLPLGPRTRHILSSEGQGPVSHRSYMTLPVTALPFVVAVDVERNCIAYDRRLASTVPNLEVDRLHAVARGECEGGRGWVAAPMCACEGRALAGHISCWAICADIVQGHPPRRRALGIVIDRNGRYRRGRRSWDSWHNANIAWNNITRCDWTEKDSNRIEGNQFCEIFFITVFANFSSSSVF